MGRAASPDEPFPIRSVVIHGHRRAYRMAGSGPVVLLLHGLGCDSTTWVPAMTHLARSYTVIAPDLLGHGQSDKPQADYSVGGYANGMRDLLTVLDVDKVTVVGHSFGGGIAMQFAYQFPERTERIGLVAPGGLGSDVSVLLRALTVPGAGVLLGALSPAVIQVVIRGGLKGLTSTRLPYTQDLGEVAEVYRALCDPQARRAVRHVTSHVLSWRGQTLSMLDRAYLAQLMPLCVVWGRNDHMIPLNHAYRAVAHVARSEMHVFERSGHFPHKDQAERFAEILAEFIESHSAARYHRGSWRALLQRGDRAQLSAVATA